MQKRYTRRANAPARQWSNLGTLWTVAASGNTVTALWGLDSPTPAASLTSLPPEDVVIMRVVGQFKVGMSLANGASDLTFGLCIRNQTWTTAGLAADLDQRWLWLRTFSSAGPTTDTRTWLPPGVVSQVTTATGALTQMAGVEGCTTVDIAPRAKLEAGQALFLVAYASDADATYTMDATCMRMLWQVRRRR